MIASLRNFVVAQCLALVGLMSGYVGELHADERPQQEFPLWTTAAPGSLGSEPTDIPTLTPFWSDQGRVSGATMIVCPGGGYNHLAPHEGEIYARWLNSLGIHAARVEIPPGEERLPLARNYPGCGSSRARGAIRMRLPGKSIPSGSA